MEIWTLFIQGINRVIHNKKMWLILFGFQFLLSVILIIPLKSQLGQMFDHSLMGQEILQGIGGSAFFEFATFHSQLVSLELVLLVIGGLVYLCLSIFLNGGILGVFIREDESFSAHQFFGNSGLYFCRFLRLFVFSLGFIVVALLIDRGLGWLFRWIAIDIEPLQVGFRILRTFFLLFLIFFINMVFAYAKIRTVLLERQDMFNTGLRSWSFVFQHMGKTLGLFYLVASLGFVLLLIYTGIGKLIGASTWFGIFVLFLWQQFYALSRIGIRLLFHSAQVNFYKEHTEPYLRAWFKEDIP